ncbi:hypothetical protein GCM10007872_23450 [Gluconobacter sphaericus NBRC 12467]|uniref:PhzF family phenazine biosynthesis protein n=1 Tax=Gluconobacter sphaericus NBRC 12467 TaxID=1307951 RepID=A0AA37SIM4_9PROT|nr:hypothetical protein AA12467_2789 [Gluconobacter sphaericus NBRC 12467]GEB43904.1 hypothetical protein GSP01_26860 [Gluconobacter sphaericus NBRC 12467]GLQ85436.1 hypothetical protein GCM10007872_23450 [Gluconobacter sphaericus NBRC 12467]
MALKGQRVGIVDTWDPVRDGTDAQFEVRAFVGDGQVFVEKVSDDIWIGGNVVTRISGTITV